MAARLLNAIGRPVRGASFFNRTHDVARIWARLTSDNLLLLAPRRVGKTSLLFRLADDAPERGYHAVYVSVAQARRELDFAKILIDAIARTPGASGAIKRLRRGPLDSLLRRTSKVGAGVVSVELDTSRPEAAEHWADLTDALARALEDLGKRWLIMVDELPIFIMTLGRDDPTGDRCRAFLNWFRALRQPMDREETVTRWILSGSVGLDTVVSRLNLGDTINDLHPVGLGAFSDATADGFLIALGASYGLPLDAATRARICTRAGWLIPFYLQIIFAKVHEAASDGPTPPTPALVDTCVDALLGPTYRAYFDYWRQRLTESLGRPEDRHALAILGAAATSPTGVSRDLLTVTLSTLITSPEARESQLRFLLDLLVSDGYLIAVEHRFRFRSELLRQYWLRRVL